MELLKEVRHTNETRHTKAETLPQHIAQPHYHRNAQCVMQCILQCGKAFLLQYTTCGLAYPMVIAHSKSLVPNSMQRKQATTEQKV